MVDSIDSATHLLVEGRMNNKMVVELYSSDLNSKNSDTFLYRFLQFKFNWKTNRFETILFNVRCSHK